MSTDGIGTNGMPISSYLPPANTGATFNATSEYRIFNYSILSGDNRLIQTIERIYEPGNPSNLAATITDYNYDNFNHMQPTSIVTSISDGATISVYNKYPLDYTIGTASNSIAKGIKILQDKHIITPVIEQYIKKSNADGTNIGTISYKPAHSAGFCF
ncbi:hypothetical protein QFZ48_004574 [Chitinophaga sp. W2I13]|uniref:hypothetical protein n=1 Tax=Chitinophaga sp. W2I13 TaxID=3373923 RepID=UPI003D1E6039